MNFRNAVYYGAASCGGLKINKLRAGHAAYPVSRRRNIEIGCVPGLHADSVVIDSLGVVLASLLPPPRHFVPPLLWQVGILIIIPLYVQFS